MEEKDPEVTPRWSLADLLAASNFTERLGTQEEEVVVLVAKRREKC